MPFAPSTSALIYLLAVRDERDQNRASFVPAAITARREVAGENLNLADAVARDAAEPLGVGDARSVDVDHGERAVRLAAGRIAPVQELRAKMFESLVERSPGA